MSWRPMGECCHCHRKMEGKPDPNRGTVIMSGAEPMQYRHADDLSRECTETRVYKCGPYSPWGQEEKWNRAESATAEGTVM